jgi:uncharacterized OsmC-like protein
MDRGDLRAIQQPLKSRYRQDAKAALITLEAEGELGSDITCSVKSGAESARAGLHPAAGGDGLSLCSGDMLLEALVACAGVTLKAVATSLDIEIRRGVVRAEGEIDVRGTLGVAEDAPVGFRSVSLTFDLDTDADEDQLATLLRLTERYCVVFQTMAGAPELSASLA